MKPFVKLDRLGQLKIDVVLFESYYPILFTCLNENKDLFLCVCCQSNKKGRKWLITKTTPNIVVRVLKNELTVREAFLMFPQVQITVFDNAEEILVDEHNELDWDNGNSVCLPDKGEFLDAEEGEFDEEILYYESLDFNNYHAAYDEIKAALSEEQIEMGKFVVEKFDISTVYCRELDFSFMNSEICKKIKKEVPKIVFGQHENNSISYHEEYKEKEKRALKENLMLKECTTMEKCIKEISEAA